MKQMICSICSYTYDEAKGIPEAGIAPGTKWEDLPSDWKCPICGAAKSAFHEKQQASAVKTSEPSETPHTDKELSAMEMSIICSNLARGCEKQYLPEESEKFSQLAEFFRSKSSPAGSGELSDILKLVEDDLSARFPYANTVSSGENDRGALRSLVWSEKVTRMLQSILERYEKEGDSMLEHSGVYVCTICGFIFIGDSAPELCPVCKVPGWKFEKTGRRA